ncbi:hypothetical protein HAX54_026713, partial [Datura stramonium]|nr:hypothetical protein [Datura stramonium]
KRSSSSAAKGTPTRRFGAKVMEPHELKRFQAQNVAKYTPENWIDEGHLKLQFPIIRDNVRKF